MPSASIVSISARIPFRMEVSVSRDGQHFVDFSPDDYSLEPGWSRSHHTDGWGADGGGAWPPGRYLVQVSVRDEVVAAGELEVVD